MSHPLFKFSVLLALLPLVTSAAERIPMVAVMPLSGVGVDATSSIVATDALSDELLKTGSVRVMERSQMENILKEQGFQQSGACDGSECAVQVGKILAVEKIVVGTFGKIGDSYSLSIRLVDVQTGEVLQSVHRMQRGAIDQVVVDVLPGMAAELTARFSGIHDTAEKRESHSVVDILPEMAAKLAAQFSGAHDTAVKRKPHSMLPKPTAKMTNTQENTGTLTDPRDHQVYRWVKIGSQIWMAQNLNYNSLNSWCYDDSASACARYGKLYSWGNMKSKSTTYGLDDVCPGGWHIPNDSEWDMLIVTVGGSASAGIKLKAKKGWHTGFFSIGLNGSDAYDFSVLPAGIRNSDGEYTRLGNGAVFWSSSEEGGSAAGSRFFDGDSRLFRNNDKKTFGFSVRCVMDKE